jgi:hypothetical protein
MGFFAAERRWVMDPRLRQIANRDPLLLGNLTTVETMKLFTAICNDAQLLLPFLHHYDRYGITEFFVAASPGFVSTVKGFMGRYRITLFEGLDVGDSVLGGTAAVTEMRRIYQQSDEWVVIVDLDEFVEFTPNIYHFISTAEQEHANVVRGIMYDRFSIDGKIIDVEGVSDLSKLFPVKARFIDEVMHGCDCKGILVKGRLTAAGAHHVFEHEKLSSETLEIAHYKWIAGSIDRLKSATRLVKQAGIPWHIEYERALDHYEQYGRFAWETFGGQLVG